MYVEERFRLPSTVLDSSIAVYSTPVEVYRLREGTLRFMHPRTSYVPESLKNRCYYPEEV